MRNDALNTITLLFCCEACKREIIARVLLLEDNKAFVENDEATFQIKCQCGANNDFTLSIERS